MHKIIAFIGLLILAILLPQFSSAYVLGILVLAGVYVILVLGLNVCLGFAGQISAAQAAFWGIGAYTSAIINMRLGLSFWVGFPLAIVITGLVGLGLAIPTIKLKGFYLAMATIGFQQICFLVFVNWRPVTMGVDGIPNIQRPSIGGYLLRSDRSFYYFLLIWVLIAIIFSLRLEKSKLGRAMKALRDNQLAAEAMGIDTNKVKCIAFMISAAMSGAAGSLYAHFARYISPDLFVFSTSTLIISMLIIGGSGSVAGAILGAILLVALPESLRFLNNYYMVIYGLGTVLIVIFMPKGLAGLIGRIIEKLKFFLEHGRGREKVNE
ncbi:MAG: branched-chain amino acid ABC transporter permease [Oscillospiraceae bacterium]|nr:branched-chain amino acid ABC transporter permease [Oscillospiraceae bacterium]